MSNDSLDMHRPTEAFRDYLEGEVIHELRRRRTFRRLRAAAVVILSVGLGMSATLASAQVRGNAQKDSLREAAKAESLLAGVRLSLAQAQLAEEQRQVSVGAQSSRALVAAELQLARAEAEVARSTLNAREIEITGLQPRDDLNAPLVNGQDFVKERLNRQLVVADRALQAAERNREEGKRRAAVGVSTELEVAELELLVLQARGQLVVLNERIQARTDYLMKGTPIEELARRIEIVEVQQELVGAQQEFANGKARVGLLERRLQAGAATALELLKAQSEMRAREIELMLLSTRLKKIQASGKGKGDELT